MRMAFWLALAWLAAAASPGQAQRQPVVAVDGGRLQGASEGGLRIFRGIPFAAPPVGALRWREPQPVVRWRGIRPATTFGARCMQQPLFADMMFRSPGISEDCLYLNVWAPAAPRRGLPVLLYIYGGGFMAGDGAERRYDGAALARQGIVVVTVNYRLGVFGFFSHPALSATSPYRASGNYGLLDQIAALDWVRRNIAAFGGDPARITIGGESAGSLAVSALMASPLSRGSIAGAIGESGAMMLRLNPQPLAAAEQAGAAFARTLGATTAAALRALPAERLLAAQGTARDIDFGAVLDGHVFTETPEATFAAGRAARVPLLLGTNSQEAPASAILGDGPATVDTYRRGLARTYGDRAAAIAALYPAETDAAVVPAATAVAGDDFLALPTWRWFDLHRRTGAPTFYYEFARVRPRALADTSGQPLPWGAVHSAEIEYALGNLDVNPLYAWTADDRRVAAVMNGYVARFVTTGDPNGPGLPAWPSAAGGLAAPPRQRIDVDTRTVPFVEQRRYAAALPLLGAR